MGRPEEPVTPLAERLPEAATTRAAGTEKFKAGDVDGAAEQYVAAIALVDKQAGLEPEDDLAAAKEIHVACLVNLATCRSARPTRTLARDLAVGTRTRRHTRRYSRTRSGIRPRAFQHATPPHRTDCTALPAPTAGAHPSPEPRAHRRAPTLCRLKQQRAYEVLDACDRAIALDDGAAKAWFRRGQACMALEQYGVARKNLVRAATLLPSSREIRECIDTCKQRAAEKGSEFKL